MSFESAFIKSNDPLKAMTLSFQIKYIGKPQSSVCIEKNFKQTGQYIDSMVVVFDLSRGAHFYVKRYIYSIILFYLSC